MASMSIQGKIFYVKDNKLWQARDSRDISLLSFSEPGQIHTIKQKYISDKLIDKNVKAVWASFEYIFVLDINNKIWIYKEDRFSPNKLDPNEFQGRNMLAGFDQSHWQQLEFLRVEIGKLITVLDINYNLYLFSEDNLNQPFEIVDTNVVSAIAGDDYICYIKTRGY